MRIGMLLLVVVLAACAAGAATSTATTATTFTVITAFAGAAAIGQLAAVGKQEVLNAANRVFGFCLVDEDRDLVARAQGFLIPAHIGQCGWAAHFRTPMDEFAFLIRRVEQDESMRIGPHELRDGGFLDLSQVGLVCGVSVMSEQR